MVRKPGGNLRLFFILFVDFVCTVYNCNMKLKEGSLVNFYSGYWGFQMEYSHRNPGLVLEIKKPVDARARRSAKVLWSDGSITTEHSTFLEAINE